MHNAGPGTAIGLPVICVYDLPGFPARKNLCRQLVLKAGGDTRVSFNEKLGRLPRMVVEFYDASHHMYRDEREILDGIEFSVDEVR